MESKVFEHLRGRHLRVGRARERAERRVGERVDEEPHAPRPRGGEERVGPRDGPGDCVPASPFSITQRRPDAATSAHDGEGLVGVEAPVHAEDVEARLAGHLARDGGPRPHRCP
jgi:hypothetical protein